jgi:hypothetical protein
MDRLQVGDAWQEGCCHHCKMIEPSDPCRWQRNKDSAFWLRDTFVNHLIWGMKLYEVINPLVLLTWLSAPQVCLCVPVYGSEDFISLGTPSGKRSQRVGCFPRKIMDPQLRLPRHSGAAVHNPSGSFAGMWEGSEIFSEVNGTVGSQSRGKKEKLALSCGLC